MVRIICFYICLMLLFSSCQESREDKIAKYLQSKNLEGSMGIGILNPDHCGSCTDYSIDWLCKNKLVNAKDVILTTGELKIEHKNRLSANGYTFIPADKDKLTRAGITLTVCTYIEMKNNEIISIKTVK